MTVEDFTATHREVYCYGWYRNGHYLYIGTTTIGARRIIQHKIIGIVLPFQEGDELHFWDAPSFEEARRLGGLAVELQSKKAFAQALEKELIALHKPDLNLNGMNKHGEDKVCKNCGSWYRAQRDWQLFCSKGCREEFWAKGKAKVPGENEVRTCPNCKQTFLLTKEDAPRNGSHYCPTCRPNVEDSYWFHNANANPPKVVKCATIGCNNQFEYNAEEKWPQLCRQCAEVLSRK